MLGPPAPEPNHAQSGTETTTSTPDPSTSGRTPDTEAETLRRHRTMEVLAKRHLTAISAHWSAYNHDDE